jgi:hypothetical protein
MGILYSTKQDDDYYDIDVDLEHIGVKHRHPFNIPVPETNISHSSIHTGKDYGFTVLNKNK